MPLAPPPGGEARATIVSSERAWDMASTGSDCRPEQRTRSSGLRLLLLIGLGHHVIFVASNSSSSTSCSCLFGSRHATAGSRGSRRTWRRSDTRCSGESAGPASSRSFPRPDAWPSGTCRRHRPMSRRGPLVHIPWWAETAGCGGRSSGLAVEVDRILVEGPLGDIAVHVVQAPRIRLLRGHAMVLSSLFSANQA